MARTWGGCRCPEQTHRELFVCPYQLTSAFHVSTARMLAGFGRWLFPAVVPAGISSSPNCVGEFFFFFFFLETRMLERGKVTPLLLQAVLPGQSRPPENCLCALRPEGKKYPKASGFLHINPAHNIIDFTVLPTLTIL